MSQVMDGQSSPELGILLSWNKLEEKGTHTGGNVLFLEGEPGYVPGEGVGFFRIELTQLLEKNSFVKF